jgi:hypothetical protein
VFSFGIVLKEELTKLAEILLKGLRKMTVQELIELAQCNSGRQLAKIVKTHPSNVYRAKRIGITPRRWYLETKEYLRNKKEAYA